MNENTTRPQDGGVIVNLTMHHATPEQVADGVVDLEGDQLVALRGLLNFEAPPTVDDIVRRAAAIADLAAAAGARRAMIGGALWLMGPLAAALAARGVTPIFAFSRRVVREEVLPDGSVRKVSSFQHAGFVPAVVG